MNRLSTHEIAAAFGLHVYPSDAGGPIKASSWVADLTDDSRLVHPGMLFVARGGGPQTAGYIKHAINAGAHAILTQLPAEAIPALEAHAPVSPPLFLLAPEVSQALAGQIAEHFFDHPANRLQLLAITGTNGKTTTAWIAQHLLRVVGHPAGLLGTILTDTGHPGGPSPASLTTPGAIELSRLLARMVEHGLTHAALEASSHALHQGRTRHLPIAAAAFTNLTGDHLDYHGTMADYADAKALLFESLDPGRYAILNLDDPAHRRMARDCSADLTTTSLDPASGADYRATLHDLTATGSRVSFITPRYRLDLRLPLVGGFNVSNALQAFAMVDRLVNLPEDAAREALEGIPAVPGRLEPVSVSATNDPAESMPAVLVDYAHTHDALNNVAAALRPLTPGRLIVVFGCGGDRDKTKRPKMAAVACRHADQVIVTSDNPRTEDPLAILRDIEAGLDPVVPSATEPDRAAAIGLAIRDARPGDTVLIAGKGHEDYQILGTDKIHFDDREHAAGALGQYHR